MHRRLQCESIKMNHQGLSVKMEISSDDNDEKDSIGEYLMGMHLVKKFSTCYNTYNAMRGETINGQETCRDIVHTRI